MTYFTFIYYSCNLVTFYDCQWKMDEIDSVMGVYYYASAA